MNPESTTGVDHDHKPLVPHVPLMSVAERGAIEREGEGEREKERNKAENSLLEKGRIQHIQRRKHNIVVRCCTSRFLQICVWSNSHHQFQLPLLLTMSFTSLSLSVSQKLFCSLRDGMVSMLLHVPVLRHKVQHDLAILLTVKAHHRPGTVHLKVHHASKAQQSQRELMG